MDQKDFKSYGMRNGFDVDSKYHKKWSVQHYHHLTSSIEGDRGRAHRWRGCCWLLPHPFQSRIIYLSYIILIILFRTTNNNLNNDGRHFHPHSLSLSLPSQFHDATTFTTITITMETLSPRLLSNFEPSQKKIWNLLFCPHRILISILINIFVWDIFIQAPANSPFVFRTISFLNVRMQLQFQHQIRSLLFLRHQFFLYISLYSLTNLSLSLIFILLTRLNRSDIY